VPFAAQAPAVHFTGVGAGLTGTDPALFEGRTGEVCLAGPPTAIGFFGPPTEVCAEAA